MNERTKYLNQAKAWVGAKRGDGVYEEMLQWFNKNPKGIKADTENCCEFTVACALKALGINQHIIPIANYSNAQAKMWKRLSETPAVGSLAYFDYKDGNGISHVEIVTEFDAETIKTINGNYNHRVVEMSRKRTHKYIAGYGIPDWPKEEIDMTKWQEAAARQIVLKKGSVGPLVLWLQKYLQERGYYKTGLLDGVYGATMQQSVRDFQRATDKLYVDGIVGWNTWSYILK